jgi:hypothetical protein
LAFDHLLEFFFTNTKVAQFSQEHISFHCWHFKFGGLNPQKSSQSPTEQFDQTMQIGNFEEDYLQIH